MELDDDPDKRDGYVAGQALTGPAASLGNRATDTLGGLAR
jgi:hypothetical protein